jgi:hypothetical protein
VLAVTHDGRNAQLRLLQPYEETLNDVSSERLLSALRRGSHLSQRRASGDYARSGEDVGSNSGGA